MPNQQRYTTAEFKQVFKLSPQVKSRKYRNVKHESKTPEPKPRR